MVTKRQRPLRDRRESAKLKNLPDLASVAVCQRLLDCSEGKETYIHGMKSTKALAVSRMSSLNVTPGIAKGGTDESELAVRQVQGCQGLRYAQ